MGVHTVRMPDNLDEYLNRLILKGYATSYANALNLITLERMMNDEKGTNLTPFKYELKDNRIKDIDIDLSEIETDNVIVSNNTERKENAAAIVSNELQQNGSRAAAQIRQEIPEDSKKDYWKGKPKRPVYPGSMNEYLQDPKRNMFEPPNE